MHYATHPPTHPPTSRGATGALVTAGAPVAMRGIYIPPHLAPRANLAPRNACASHPTRAGFAQARHKARPRLRGHIVKLSSSVITGALRAVEPARQAPAATVAVSGGITVTSHAGTFRANGGATSAQAFTYDRELVRDLILGKAHATAGADNLAVTVRGLTRTLAAVDALPELAHADSIGTADAVLASWVAGATDRKGMMPTLSCVQFDGGSMAATDRFRLHYAPTTALGTALVPASALSWIKSGALGVGMSDTAVTVSAGTVSVTVMPGLGDFPKWRLILPTDAPLFADADAVQTLRPYLADKACAFVRFTPDGTELVATDGTKRAHPIPGAVLATLPTVTPHRVTVRADYLRDALALPSRATLYSASSERALTIDYGDGVGALVMPIRN